MARKGNSAEEIISFLRQADVRLAQGNTVGKVCRSKGNIEHPVKLVIRSLEDIA